MNGKISLKVNVSKSKYNIIKHAQEIVDEVNKRTIGKLYNTALDICNNAVNAYYNDFNPHLYVRERSLDTAYKISIDKNNMLDF